MLKQVVLSCPSNLYAELFIYEFVQTIKATGTSFLIIRYLNCAMKLEHGEADVANFISITILHHSSWAYLCMFKYNW
jgi:hypothetical protein